MHRVVVLALHDVIAFDLATPVEVLGRVTNGQGVPLYDVKVAGPVRSVRAGPMQIVVPHGVDAIADADTVIVPGRYDPTAPLEQSAVEALRRAAARGTRIASICVGALDVAATGLLDGMRATTHWRAAGMLSSRHPAVAVDPDVLFVDSGQFLSSAGAAAGIDLCLHLIKNDHGAEVAASAARSTVVPLTREAGQAQYVIDESLGDTSLTAVLQWIDEHAHEPIGVADIATRAAVSTRTLNRYFAQELRMPPSRWLIRARVRRAQRLLESTELPVDQIAGLSGLGSASNLRAHFADVVGTTPARYRRALAASTGSGREWRA